MIFRVIVIKELFWTQYTLDMLFFWLSEEMVRNVLRAYKLIALELYEYKKENIESYWSIKILINFEWQDIRLLSNSKNLDSLLFSLFVSWFDVKNINYINENKIDQEKIYEIISAKNKEAEQWIQEQEDLLKQQEHKNEEFFNDQNLEKIQNLTKEFLEKVPDFIEKAKDTLPKSDIKELYWQRQELSKLKMWSNAEKISSFLETAYNNFNRLEQDFLTFQESGNIDVEWSNITDTYLAAEVKKLEKAKSLLKLWWAKWWEDMLYANFWWILIYFKLIKKDLTAKAKDFSKDFPQIFEYLLLGLIFIQLFATVYFLLSNLSTNINEYIYVMFIRFWVFWLVLYWINFINKKSLLYNILLLCGWISISLLIIFILKQNFIF